MSFKNCSIVFAGDNSIVYLSSNRNNTYSAKITVYSNSVVYIGKNNYFNGATHIIASEEKHVFIGDEGLYSFGCWFRTADAHLVYDGSSKQRVNPSRSILVGDHVWIGQSSLILKGSQIGSGAIVGAGSVVAGKRLTSNAVYGGSPARLLKENLFFVRDSVHAYTESETDEKNIHESDEWLYSYEKAETFGLTEIEAALKEAPDAAKRLSYLKKLARTSSAKNRFSVGPEPTKSPKKRR